MDRDAVEEIKSEFRRQVGVLSEELGGQLSAVIEGQQRRGEQLAALSTRVEDLGASVEALRVGPQQGFAELRAELHSEVGALRSEVADALTALRLHAFLDSPTGEFEHRLSVLEAAVAELQGRAKPPQP